jgi:NAD-dependent deacetylase
MGRSDGPLLLRSMTLHDEFRQLPAAVGCLACLHLRRKLRPDLPPAGGRLQPPLCKVCDAKIRPGVVWFGEALPEAPWRAARDAAKHCDVFLVCGTSSLVQPAASLTDMADDAGATTIQINPNPTDADDSVTFTIRASAGTVLPQLVAEAWTPPS